MTSRIILLVALTAPAAGAQMDTSTPDGLTLHWDAGGRIVGVRVGRRELPMLPDPGGFTITVRKPVDDDTPSLLPGGDWEQARDGAAPEGWSLGERWSVDEAGGRDGSACAMVTNPGNESSRSGEMFSPNVPVRVGERYLLTFWARVRGTGGNYPPHLYIEQLQEDGTWAHPQTGIPTASGDRDWWRLSQAVTVLPGTRYLRVYGNIYSGYGTLWVDDIRLVRLSEALSGEVLEGQMHGTEQGARFTAELPDAGLEFSADITPHPAHLRVDAVVRSQGQADLALECGLVLPVDLSGWRWHDSIQSCRDVAEEGSYRATGDWGRFAISLYPFSCVEDGVSALSLGSPTDVPRVNVVQASADRGLAVSYRLGVSPRTARFPSSASFSAEVFLSDPEWGLRATAAKYYTLHPEQFTERTEAEGCWYLGYHQPIEQPEDFALRFHEINGGPPTWEHDRDAGILGFKYTEPWGAWICFRFASVDGKGYQAKSVAEAEELLARAAELPDESLMGLEPHAFGTLPLRTWARTIQGCALEAPGGAHYVEFGYGLQNFALNPNPDLLSPNRWDVSRQYEIEEVFRRSREAGAEVPGVYLDSIAPWWAARVSAREDHLAFAHHPLVYQDDDPQLLLMPLFEWIEFCRRLAEDLRPQGKLVMANTFAPAHTLFSPYLDMMGAGEGSTARYAASYPFQRVMAYRKPLSVLDYDLMKTDVPPKDKEDAIWAGLPYAVFPGTASFEDPAVYDTLRPLYRRAMPIFLEIAKAGWEPITYARAQPAELQLERYGSHDAGTTYLAMRNPTDAAVTARISPVAPGFSAAGAEATELVTGGSVRPVDGLYEVPLEPGKCAVLRFAAN